VPALAAVLELDPVELIKVDRNDD